MGRETKSSSCYWKESQGRGVYFNLFNSSLIFPFIYIFYIIFLYKGNGKQVDVSNSQKLKMFSFISAVYIFPDFRVTLYLALSGMVIIYACCSDINSTLIESQNCPED